jgi:hypothetical protein
MKLNSVKPGPMLAVAVAGLVVGLAMPAAARETKHVISGSSIKKHSISGNRLKANTLTGAQIKESTLGTVPKARALPPVVWHPLALENGWSSFTAVRPVSYAVDAGGFVHFKGALHCLGTTSTCATSTSSTDAFAMPKALWPNDAVNLLAYASGIRYGEIDIFDTGEVAPFDSPASPDDSKDYLDLDGLSYAP